MARKQLQHVTVLLYVANKYMYYVCVYSHFGAASRCVLFNVDSSEPKEGTKGPCVHVPLCTSLEAMPALAVVSRAIPTLALYPAFEFAERLGTRLR